MAELRELGVTVSAIADAIAVTTVFNLIDRVADSLDFDVPPAESFDRRADRMLAARYSLPPAQMGDSPLARAG